jgi:hypothetical protein
VLLVFGPERLPELLRNLGRMIRQLRQTYIAFVTEFRDELAPIATEIDAATRDLRQDLYAIREAADIRGLVPTITTEDLNANPPNSIGNTPANTSANTAHITTPTANPTPVLPAASPSSTTNTIATPLSNPVASASSNGHAHPASLNGHAPSRSASKLVTAHAPVALSDGNPWASIGAPIRSDKLDDDNPWKG